MRLGSRGACPRGGFALVELLLALSVVLVMGMLVWPCYSSTRAQARQIIARHLESELNGTYARWVALGGTISGNPNTSQVLAVLTSTPGANVVISDPGGGSSGTPDVVQDGGSSNQVRLPQSIIDAMDLQTTIDSGAHVIHYADGQYDISFNANLGTFTVTTSDPASANVMVGGGAGGCAPSEGTEEGDFSLAGMVFEDGDNDGVQAANEVGIEQVTMTLTGTTSGGHSLGQTTLTAADGSFVFTKLPTGTYKLLETQPEGYLPGKQKAGTLGGTIGSGSISNIPITSAAGTVYTFGNIPGASLSGIVFADANSDGVKQGGEVGVANATLSLTGTNDLGEAVLVELTTGSTGVFAFTALRPGTYILNETIPSGYSEGAIGVGTLGGNVLSGGVGGITIGVGAAGTGYSFANLPASTPPDAPSGLTLTTVSATEVYITWVDNSDDETGFIIERRPAGSGPWDEIGDVAANTTIFVDTTADPEADFEYRVRAYNDAGESSNSNIITVSIPPLAGGSGGSGGSSSYPSGVYLTAGSGFAGATAQPDPVGDSQLPGYDAKVIARWDVVPYQTFTGDFNVGVVAFHMNGIDHVSFSVNGGPWEEVREMAANPQTANTSDLGVQTAGIVEYWAKLQASDFSDGIVEVRAIAYPTVGVPRILNSLTLYANSGGSLPALVRYVSPTGNDTTGDGSQGNPYASVGKAVSSIQSAQGSIAGGQIYLAAGDYTYVSGSVRPTIPTTTSRWLTIEPAPGVSREQARFTSGTHPGLWRTNVHLKNVTLATAGGTILMNNGGATWLDGCNYIGPGAANTHITASGQTVQYWTDSMVQEAQVAFRTVEYVRNCYTERLGEDAFKLVNMIVNSEVKKILFTQAGYHPDVWQYYSNDPAAPFENAIIYGLKAREISGQGLGPTNARNLAFVNVDVDITADGMTPGVAQNFQGAGLMDHVVIKDSRFVGKNTWRVDLGLNAHNVVVENTQWIPGPFPSPANPPGVVYR